MTMELYDGTDHDGLFDVQAKCFAAIAALNTARHATVPDAVATALAQYELIASSSLPEWQAITAGIAGTLSSWQSGGGSLAQGLAGIALRLLVQFAADDADQPDNGAATALDYLIAQMGAEGDYVTASTLTTTLAAALTNAGDTAILVTLLRGDSQTEQNALVETITATVTAPGQSPTIAFLAPLTVGDRLSQTWPAGSGTNLSLSATDPAGSLLSNGDFEDTSFDANIPDGWIVVVGTPGTTVLVTNPEVQTVAITGTPTGGSYLLQWTSPAGVTRSTGTILWNADGGSVQSALRTIPGLEYVTVATTGTTPNFTHAVTFAAVAGDISQLTSVNHLTGGTTPTITHATTTPGDPGSYKGRALRLACNGVELTEVAHPLTGLAADAVYFCHARLRRTGATAGGAIDMEIVDGIGGSVVADAAGTDNSLTVDATAIPDSSHASQSFSFRIPRTISQPVYLQLRISSAIDNACSIYVDEVTVTRATQLYPGGPWVSVVGGAAPAIVGDSWMLGVANDRSGQIQEWYNRAFGMAERGLLLPVAGTSLIPEAVLS